MNRVHGFEYALTDEESGEDLGFHRVMGAGGYFGDGCLYQFTNGRRPTEKVLDTLTRRCDRMVREDGEALVLANPDVFPPERHRKLKGVRVTGIRVV